MRLHVQLSMKTLALRCLLIQQQGRVCSFAPASFTVRRSASIFGTNFRPPGFPRHQPQEQQHDQTPSSAFSLLGSYRALAENATETSSNVAAAAVATAPRSLQQQRVFGAESTTPAPSKAAIQNLLMSKFGAAATDYQKGFAIISFITLLNASCAPIWHTVFDGVNTPPPLFLNAIVSVVAFLGLIAGAPLLDGQVEKGQPLATEATTPSKKWSKKSFRGGMELGLWKGLGTTCHIWGMALTTANHGAFILQLTTLIVPIIQGLRGAEQIPRSIQMAVALALMGIYAFTQDPAGVQNVAADPGQVEMGDALVLGAALFYSLYDIQTFYWGREVPRTELVTIKVGFQAALTVLLCAGAVGGEVAEYFQNGPDYSVLIPTVLWSGLVVNALATFLQVAGMQAVGPTRAQTIFASQPLWASIMNFVFLGEGIGLQGLLGGGSFLGALFLASNSEAPKINEGQQERKEKK